MNIRFKFRVWSDYHKKFVIVDSEFGYWRLFEKCNIGIRKSFDRESDYQTPSHVEDYVVQQFTGLKDKNKIAIYEGDVVYYSSSRDSVFFHAEVYYDDKTARFKVKGKQHNLDLYSMHDYYGSYTVVGNIFENRELLDND